MSSIQTVFEYIQTTDVYRAFLLRNIAIPLDFISKPNYLLWVMGKRFHFRD